MELKRIKAHLQNFKKDERYELYMVGPFGRRVNFQSQQRRALILAYCLTKANDGIAEKRIAVIGCGVTGMTITAALAINGAFVTPYEKKKQNEDLIGSCSSRFIHPNVNFIPEEALSFTTDLPIMNWHADTAEKVIIQIKDQLELYRSKRIEIPGRIEQTKRTEVRKILHSENSKLRLHVEDGTATGTITGLFDVVICCTGFSSENKLHSTRSEEKHLNSLTYWEGNRISQKQIEQGLTEVLIIGGGDGGTIDALEHGVGLTSEDIYKLALKACIHYPDDPLSMDTSHFPEKPKHFLKTTLVIKSGSHPTPWHKRLLEVYKSRPDEEPKNKAIIQIVEGDEVTYDHIEGHIAVQLNSQGDQWKASVNTSHVLVRTGASHNADLICLFTQKAPEIIKTAEESASPFQTTEYFPDFCTSAYPEPKSKYLKDKAETTLQKWAISYKEAAEQHDFKVSLTAVMQQDRQPVYVACQLKGSALERLPGLPHLFGIPLKVKQRRRFRTSPPNRIS